MSEKAADWIAKREREILLDNQTEPAVGTTAAFVMERRVQAIIDYLTWGQSEAPMSDTIDLVASLDAERLHRRRAARAARLAYEEKRVRVDVAPRRYYQLGDIVKYPNGERLVVTYDSWALGEPVGVGTSELEWRPDPNVPCTLTASLLDSIVSGQYLLVFDEQHPDGRLIGSDDASAGSFFESRMMHPLSALAFLFQRGLIPC